MRWGRATVPPLRDWTVLGRPVGEWPYLALMTLGGVNAVKQGVVRPVDLPVEWGVAAGQLLIGLSALGVVVCTLVGQRVGLRLLWVFAAASCVTAPLVTAAIVDAPVVDSVITAIVAAILVSGIVWYGRRRLHAAITRRVWPQVLAEHAAAADEFVATIGALSLAQWNVRPTAEGWSPAEITDHLARTYSQYAGESRGKNPMRIRLRLPQRILIRALVKPRLLNGAPFPKARAPRALRPASGPETPADGVALFRAAGAACVRDLSLLAERRPHRQLIHPYFGALPLYDLVRFAAHHVRHHRRQLLAAVATPQHQGGSHDHTP